MKISPLIRCAVCGFCILVLLASCATEQKLPPIQKEGKPLEQPQVVPEKQIIPKPTGETLHCREETERSFNLTGIEAMPFIRTTFIDVDGDGKQDMIAGSKGGTLQLYRNKADGTSQRWELQKGYFDGIKLNAFSAPAMADLDGDGKLEVVVGAGGFSSESGKIIIFRNEGTVRSPKWSQIKHIDLKVGNDATVTAVDFDHDGKIDIIASNSNGKVFFFKNTSAGSVIRFSQVHSPFKDKSFGMYAVPSAVLINDKLFVAIGNALGKLSMFEMKSNGGTFSMRELKSPLATRSFASPSFAALEDKNRYDLVLSDGDGQLSYFENRNSNFTDWSAHKGFFDTRIYAGPACAPTVTCIGEKTCMIVGNMDGTFRFYEYRKAGEPLPWVERKGYLNGIKVSGFARGVFTTWEGKELIIAGQSNGGVRAFLNTGSLSSPQWREEKRFFLGVSIPFHSTPTIFDIDGDGTWELISGAEDGKIYGFRIRSVKNGLPVWERIQGVFDTIKVPSFSAPTLVREGDTFYLFVGQQDGKIRTYTAKIEGRALRSRIDYREITFTEKDYLKEIRVQNHSSPFVNVKDGTIDLISGDYDGNLRHFVCRKSVLYSEAAQ
jgi:WD40 repeat protein